MSRPGQAKQQKGKSTSQLGELHLERLKCHADVSGRFPASAKKMGDEFNVICHHCKGNDKLDLDLFLFCEVESCPAVYHHYCIDAAVADAVMRKPELLHHPILCPLCSLSSLEIGQIWKNNQHHAVFIDAKIELVNNLDSNTIDTFKTIAESSSEWTSENTHYRSESDQRELAELYIARKKERRPKSYRPTKPIIDDSAARPAISAAATSLPVHNLLQLGNGHMDIPLRSDENAFM